MGLGIGQTTPDSVQLLQRETKSRLVAFALESLRVELELVDGASSVGFSLLYCITSRFERIVLRIFTQYRSGIAHNLLYCKVKSYCPAWSCFAEIFDVLVRVGRQELEGGIQKIIVLGVAFPWQHAAHRPVALLLWC